MYTELYLKTEKNKKYNHNGNTRRGDFNQYFGDYEWVSNYEYVLKIHLLGKQDPLIFTERETEEKPIEECKKTLMQIEKLLI